jgi:hypothetical protein
MKDGDGKMIKGSLFSEQMLIESYHASTVAVVKEDTMGNRGARDRLTFCVYYACSVTLVLFIRHKTEGRHCDM